MKEILLLLYHLTVKKVLTIFL